MCLDHCLLYRDPHKEHEKLRLPICSSDNTNICVAASMTTEIPKNVLKGIKSLTAPSTDGLNENSLPTNVEPLHYSLVIHPNIEGDDPSNFTFRVSLKSC